MKEVSSKALQLKILSTEEFPLHHYFFSRLNKLRIFRNCSILGRFPKLARPMQHYPSRQIYSLLSDEFLRRITNARNKQFVAGRKEGGAMKITARRVLLGAILAALMFPTASCVVYERDHFYQDHYYRNYDRDYDTRNYRYRR